jgi:hypothetical protein
MFKTIKQLFNKDKVELDQRFAKIEQAIEDEKQAREQAEAALAAANEELSVFRTKAAADAAKYDSIEPWIEVKSDGIDPIKGMVIECDWNPAFIQFLKENGITAKDEDTAVQKYIALLYEDIVNKMEQKVIDASDKPGKVSDFA